MKSFDVDRGPAATLAKVVSRWALCAMLCVLAASCKGCPVGGGSGAGPADAGVCTPQHPPVCGGTRWVAVKKNPAVPCPLSPASAAAGWKVAPLATTAGKLPDPLDRTCIYTHAPPAAAALCALEAELVPADGLASLVEECRHVYPAGFQESLAETFRVALHAQAGGVEQLAAPPPRQARIVAADTDPDRFDGQPEDCRDSHGCTVAHVAKDLVCPQRTRGVCAGQVGWAEALPHTGPDGGRYGYPSELAAAVLRAFDAWRADLMAGRPVPAHLVFNLSLGWESDASCSEPGGPDTAVRALRYAACNGVLSVAAAGNAHRSDASPAQMACPGRLEVETISPEACAGLVDDAFLAHRRELLGAAWSPVPATAKPLLYAAGGLDYLDRPVVPVRPSARPVLAAPAVGGVSWASPLRDAATSPRTPLSGTSVSAAVVSGTAAAVWAYRPALRPDELMALVADAAVPVSPAIPAGHGLFNHSTVRRVSLCRALGAAGQTASCPALRTGETNPAPAGAVPPGTLLPQTYAPATAGACTAGPANSPGLVVPEPNNPRCPHCVLKLAHGTNNSQPAFMGALAGGASLHQLCLFVQDASGAVRTFTLDPATFGAAATAGGAAARLAIPPPAPDARAWLVWEQADMANPQQRVTVGQTVYVIP